MIMTYKAANNKHNGPELSPGSHWPRPEYNKTDAERSQTAPAQPSRDSVNAQRKGTDRVRSHDNRGPLSDNGLTPATTIISEILGKPSTKLAYKRNHLTLQMQEKLKEVKARLNFEGCSRRNLKIQKVSQHSESRTPNVRGEHGKGRRSGRSRSMSGSPKPTSVFSRIRHGRSKSPRHMVEGKGRKKGGVFGRLRGKGKNVSARSESRYQSSRSGRTESVPRKRHYEGTCSRRTEVLSKSEDIGRGTGSQAAKVERWAMPTWCHMFNSMLTGSAKVWFDDLPPESVDSYDDLKKAFLANFLQQKKCIKDPVEIHHIKQRDKESTEDFIQRFKTESRHVKGASECMRISGFMHGITNPELIKRLHDNIPKSMDKMMRTTTTFLRGEVAASNQAWKKTLPAWKQQEAG
ncbi:reverse transcriptase domain-containing protein [Tanacetum coccineum]|uniref:Reverse transcriptase domain-containing protein n=1 Tax=Tanacetum coccineum TaxID=301880 RepID=A0ABQ4XSG9_9ASTR